MHMAAFNLLAVFVAAALCSAQAADFGMFVQNALKARAKKLTGVRYLGSPASEADYVPRENATAMQRVKLSKGLKAEYVARNVGYSGDMLAFYPNDINYTHIIVCNELSLAEMKNNAGVQRIEVATGKVETILFGMDRCDGIRTSPWGTILATEETDHGAAYEIFDPLNTSDEWIADRESGEVVTEFEGTTPSENIFKREALPIMAWEGLAILPSGVIYAGDELRPGTNVLDLDGGALFKFVPSTAYKGGMVTPSSSPFSKGRTYALVVSCEPTDSSGFPQYGQGCEVGVAAWVEVDPKYARRSAHSRGATGYYRPEELHLDPLYNGPGVRWCVANTGNYEGGNPGEVICVVDSVPLAHATWYDERTGYGYQSRDNGRSPLNATATRFIEGGDRFNSFDNLAFNPVSDVLYVVEDDTYGEVYACLPDGMDDDYMSDGCVPFLSVVDPEAEPTGFTVDGSGVVAYIHVQHGECPEALKDFVSNPLDGCTDDLIKITGFHLPQMG